MKKPDDSTAFNVYFKSTNKLIRSQDVHSFRMETLIIIVAFNHIKGLNHRSLYKLWIINEGAQVFFMLWPYFQLWFQI